MQVYITYILTWIYKVLINAINWDGALPKLVQDFSLLLRKNFKCQGIIKWEFILRSGNKCSLWEHMRQGTAKVGAEGGLHPQLCPFPKASQLLLSLP